MESSRQKTFGYEFELGNCKNVEASLPSKKNDIFVITADGCKVVLKLLEDKFDLLPGYWVKGQDGTTHWIDFVLYSGDEKEFDLMQIDQAVLAFALSIGNQSDELTIQDTSCKIEKNQLTASWMGLNIELPIKPGKNPDNL